MFVQCSPRWYLQLVDPPRPKRGRYDNLSEPALHIKNKLMQATVYNTKCNTIYLPALGYINIDFLRLMTVHNINNKYCLVCFIANTVGTDLIWTLDIIISIYT